MSLNYSPPSLRHPQPQKSHTTRNENPSSSTRRTTTVQGLSGYSMPRMSLLDVPYGLLYSRKVPTGQNTERSVSPFSVPLPTKQIRLSDPFYAAIDIFEVVNNDQTNQYALHTTAGCVASPGSGGQTGTQGSTACDQNQNSGSGCTVRDADTASAGKGFNDAQGGVYVAAFEVRFRTVFLLHGFSSQSRRRNLVSKS